MLPSLPRTGNTILPYPLGQKSLYGPRRAAHRGGILAHASFATPHSGSRPCNRRPYWARSASGRTGLHDPSRGRFHHIVASDQRGHRHGRRRLGAPGVSKSPTRTQQPPGPHPHAGGNPRRDSWPLSPAGLEGPRNQLCRRSCRLGHPESAHSPALTALRHIPEPAVCTRPRKRSNPPFNVGIVWSQRRRGPAERSRLHSQVCPYPPLGPVTPWWRRPPSPGSTP